MKNFFNILELESEPCTCLGRQDTYLIDSENPVCREKSIRTKIVGFGFKSCTCYASYGSYDAFIGSNCQTVCNQGIDARAYTFVGNITETYV